MDQVYKMNYRIAICDDVPADLKYTSKLVSDWAATTSNYVTVETYLSAEAFLFQYAEDKTCDMLLLDIEMGGMDGVRLSKTVRAENREVQIVFITGYMDYVADGYDVEALHYLLKPVSREKLFTVLERAAERLKRNERALMLNCIGETARVPLYEISYLEVRQNYVTVHAKAEYTVKKPLSEIEKELDDGFFRIGRSYIVNLRFISRITKTEAQLRNGSAVPLPRGLYEALNRAMIERF
jgi:DNA-binding LytR/AlgR family response regulator